MLENVLQIQSYSYNSEALPLLVTAALVLFMSALTVTHERASPVAMPLFLLALSTSVWMLGFGLMYCAQDTPTAHWWARFAHGGIVFIPSSALFFAARVVRSDTFDRLGRALSFSVLVSVMYLVLAFSSPEFVAGIDNRWWGPYPRYGAIGSTFVVFLGILVATCMRLFYNAVRQSPADTAMHRRSKLFLVASCVGAIGFADFLPMFGFDVYPTGHITMLCLFAITTYVTWRYRLVDLTPAFVGQQLTETMTDALIVMDRDGMVRLINSETCRLLGLEEDDIVGRPITDLLDGRLSQHIDSLAGGKAVRDREHVLPAADGGEVTVILNASLMRDRFRNPVAYLYNIRDISHRKAAEDRIRQLAYQDDLTDLPNRVQFNEQLETCLAVAGAEGMAVTTLFLDLDRFKRINDTLGHSAGDELLRQVAERLRHCIRQTDLLGAAHPSGASSFVARLGGDEFIVCLFDLKDKDEAAMVCQRILKTLARPFQLEQYEVFVSASIGVSRFPEDGTDVQSLLKNADTAMYHAKESGRDNFQYYDASMNATAMERLALEADLRKALDRDELSLAYQPQIDQITGEIIGAEALLRWVHPVRGTVSPADFIPLAEETGLITRIGTWVLNEACRQTAAWHRDGLGPITVAVNLSERQFRRQNLLRAVAGALEASGLPPASLDIELTESMLMNKATAAVETLKCLKMMGVKISVDDFGTGYSSLSYLKRFPIDVLKVDESFVRDVAANPDDAAITTAIIAMARSLNIDVIAEGVETPAQMQFLIDHGCTKMQGYMFGRPMPAGQFATLLRNAMTDTGPAASDDTATVLNFSRA